MPENLFDLTGKVALITGGNAGLGLSFAEGLARAGADIVIWGRRAEQNETAAQQLKRHDGRVLAQSVDVSDEAAVAKAMETAAREMGRLDCVIANAGIATTAPIDQMTTDIWRELIDISLDGAFFTAREAARHMKARSESGDRGGSIIFCGSLTIFTGVPGLSHYAAAKGALNSMSKVLAVELGAFDIRVNTIAPGLIATDLMIGNPEGEALLEATRARSPIKTLGRPEDLQGIVVYLASDMSRYHSGDTITLDGGMMAQCY